MYTISGILDDIDRGILAHNMIETCFSYRLIYFVNENGRGEKHYMDTQYSGLRAALENIIRGNLTTTNTIVVAEVTVWKNGKSVSLLSKAYSFSLLSFLHNCCLYYLSLFFHIFVENIHSN